MAGWGDDPVLDELRGLLANGWVPVAVAETRTEDAVTIERAGEQRELRSDHVAFHRYVEGIKEDYPGITRR